MRKFLQKIPKPYYAVLLVMLILSAGIIGPSRVHAFDITNPFGVDIAPRDNLDDDSTSEVDTEAPSPGEAKKAAAADNNCGWTNPAGCIVAAVDYFVSMIVTLFGALTVLGSIALDIALKLSVLDLHKYLADGSPLIKIWAIARDFSNIFFIFILLYVGLGTMLRIKSIAGDWQRRVIAVLITALLINFSLPLTRAVVDVSNVFTLQFYGKVSKGYQENKQSWDFDAIITQFDKTVGAQLIEKMNDARAADAYIKGSNDWAGGFQIVFSGLFDIIILLVAAFVLFFGAVIVIARTIVLIFLVILSPFPFVMHHFARTKKYTDSYISTLSDQCIFLPAFMFMLYFSLRVVNSVVDLVGAGGAGNFIANVVAYVIAVGSMALAVFVATDMGAAGASLATGYAKTAVGAGVGAIGLGGGALASMTGVRAAGKYLASTGAAQWIDNKTGNRISRAAVAAPNFIQEKANLGFDKLAGTKGGFMTTGKERAEAASKDLAERAAHAGREKAEMDQKVKDLQNRAKAEGHDKDGDSHAAFIETMDAKTQKEYFKAMDDKKKIAIAGVKDIKTRLGKNVGTDEIDAAIDLKTAKDLKEDKQKASDDKAYKNPNDLAAFIKDNDKIKTDDRKREFYKSLKDDQKVQLEKILSTPEYADLKKILDEAPFEDRKAGIMAGLEGNTAGQIAYLLSPKLADKKSDQESFFSALNVADKGKLLIKLKTSGNAGQVKLANELEGSITQQSKQEEVQDSAKNQAYLSVLKGEMPGNVEMSLKNLPDDLLNKNIRLLLSPRVASSVTPAVLQRIKLPAGKKSAFKAQLLNLPPGSGLDSALTMPGTGYLHTHKNWKEL